MRGREATIANALINTGMDEYIALGTCCLVSHTGYLIGVTLEMS
jgi:hypothetical protein